MSGRSHQVDGKCWCHQNHKSKADVVLRFIDHETDIDLLPWQRKYLRNAYDALSTGNFRLQSFSITSGRGKTYISGVMEKKLRGIEPTICFIDEESHGERNEI